MSAIPTNKAAAQTVCVVSARDYRKYFQGCDHGDVVKDERATPSLQDPVWTGNERRIGSERRSGKHDRRWDQQKSRRWRVLDRRHINVSMKSSLRTEPSREKAE